MSIGYVCFKCHARRALKESFAGFQRQPPSAGFISLSSNARLSGHITENGESTQKPQQNPPRLKTRHAETVRSEGFDPALESLFSSTAPNLQSQYIYPRSRPLVNTPTRNDSQRLNARQTRLKEQLSLDTKTVQQAWANFVHLYGAEGSELSSFNHALDLDQLLKSGTLRALRKEVIRKSLQDRLLENPQLNLPSPAEVLQTYAKLGILSVRGWAATIWKILGVIVNSRPYVLECPTERINNAQNQTGDLLKELLEVWKIFMKCFGRSSQDIRGRDDMGSNQLRRYCGEGILCTSIPQVLGVDQGWENLPDLATLTKSRRKLSTDIRNRFLTFVPRLRPDWDSRVIAVAAVVTFDLLHMNSQETSQRSLKFQSAPYFLHFMAYLIRGASLEEGIARQRLMGESDVAPQSIEKYLEGWTNIQQRANAVLSSGSKSSFCVNLNGPSKPTSLLTKQESHSLRYQLKKALNPIDMNLINILWDNLEKENVDGHFMIDDEQDIYAEFLRAYMSLKRPDQAINVWNRMIQSGRVPAQQHWYAMLLGCRQARDTAALQSIWQKMIEAEVQPGNQCWTTLILGLIQGGKWQQALQSLENLGQAWRTRSAFEATLQSQKSQSKPDSVSHETLVEELTPSMVPVNAIVSALVISGKLEAVESVLRWAQAQQLRPDTATFNVTLRSAIRDGKEEEVAKIMRLMKKTGCQPDIVTFTIILDGLFRNPASSFHTESPQAQEEMVSNVLQQMTEHAIEPNKHTYGTLLDGMLDKRSLNIAAARAVLDHMEKRNVQPSAHVYTILLTHYFDSEPPDLVSVDGLWNFIRHKRDRVDHIFYDRLIEGYARAGAVDKMLGILRQILPSQGKQPGWTALHAALQALAKVREWNLIVELLYDVEDEDGPFRHSTRFSSARDQFWALVDGLRERGVLPEDHRQKILPPIQN